MFMKKLVPLKVWAISATGAALATKDPVIAYLIIACCLL
jgi:hypothetical protein